MRSGNDTANFAGSFCTSSFAQLVFMQSTMRSTGCPDISMRISAALVILLVMWAHSSVCSDLGLAFGFCFGFMFMPRHGRSGWHRMCPNSAFHEPNLFPHSVQGAVAPVLKMEAWLGSGFRFIGLRLRGEAASEGAKGEEGEPS